MIREFQFDESINSRALFEECRAQGLCSISRFPKQLRNRGVEDPDVLSTIPMQRTMVSGDLNMRRDHEVHFPSLHCGIIFIGNSDDVPHTVTDDDYRRLLRMFKDIFPDWHKLDFSNSVVTLTEREIVVQHAVNQRLVDDFYARMTDAMLTDGVRSALSGNTGRGRFLRS